MGFSELIQKHKKMKSFADYNEEYSYYAAKDFEDLLRSSPSSVLLTIDNKELRVIINDVKYGVELEDDKYLLTRFSDELILGSYANWSDDSWIVSSKERFTDKGHRSYRLKRCNGVLKFTNKKGEIISIDAHIYNKLFYTEGVDKYTAIVMPDGLSQAMIPNTDVTKDIARNMRLLIGEQAFIVTYIDKTTQKGLIQVTLSEVMHDRDDNFEDQVADSPYVDGLAGKDYIFLGGLSQYVADDEVIEWKAENGCIDIIETSQNTVIVKAVADGDTSLIARCRDKSYIKKIKVKYKEFN